MSTLIVLDFDGIHTADEVLNKVRSLQKEDLVDLEDACVVERDRTGKIHIKQAVNLTALGATRGGTWGAIVGYVGGQSFPEPARRHGHRRGRRGCVRLTLAGLWHR